MSGARPVAVFRPANAVWTLHDSALGRLEDLSCSGVRRERGPDGYARDFHIVLPHRGSFVLHTGRAALQSDCNTAVFLGGDSEYAVSHPAGGDESLVFTPTNDILAELSGDALRPGAGAEASRSRVVSPATQLAAKRLRQSASEGDALELEERLLSFLRRLLADAGQLADSAERKDHPAVARAKAFLHAHLSDDPSLVQVAEAISVSPAHLTHIFHAAEGLPLYRYALRLRLAWALDRLDASESLTSLAMELGFSSHSHFTSAFRKAFGVSPSTLRTELRGRAADPPKRFRVPTRPLCAARTGDLAATALRLDRFRPLAHKPPLRRAGPARAREP